MAGLKLVSTSASKLDSYPVTPGQMIFVRDQRAIYIDTDVRTSYQQIIVLQEEAHRQALAKPLYGFYFVESTRTLWEYNGTNWINVTSEVDKQIVFDDKDNFPDPGEPNVLYVDGTSMYRYIGGAYVPMSKSVTINWEAI